MDVMTEYKPRPIKDSVSPAPLRVSTTRLLVSEAGTFSSDDLQDILDILMHAASLGCEFRERVPGKGVH